MQVRLGCEAKEGHVDVVFLGCTLDSEEVHGSCGADSGTKSFLFDSIFCGV